MRQKKPPRSLSRRRLLRIGFGSFGLLAGSDLLSGPWRLSGLAAEPAPACVVRPEQTEGPYFVDEKLNRSDIRVDPSDKSLRAGVPLRLDFRVSRVAGGACTPLSNAIVDVWQCDAQGVYSGVRDPRFDTRGKKFLRGYQTTSANGSCSFLTIYPGWYEGRAVHIHFKVRSSNASGTHEFTSQLYFNEAVTDDVFKQPPYSAKPGRRTSNDRDFLFRRGGKDLLLNPVKDGQAYAATFTIGLLSA